jgi:catechol-2,3-dioxygenase
MEVKELGHLVLYVRDIERSAHFYGQVLGWRQIVGPGGEGVDLGPGGPPIAMFSAPSNRTHHELLLIEVGEDAAAMPAGKRLGMYHFGLKIGTTDDELRAARDKLVETGTPILGMSDHTMTHSLYIADPDGNEVELYVDVPGVNWEDPNLMATPTKQLVL